LQFSCPTWPIKCLLSVDRYAVIPGAGYIHVESVEHVELDELTDADAVPDGFASALALRGELAALYADQLAAGQRAYRVRFRLFNAEEQAAAKAERAACKSAKRSKS